MNDSNRYLVGYEIARQLVEDGELDRAVSVYELLHYAAQANQETGWMVRCLSDLAAIASVHDVETAAQLLESAHQIDREDPSVLENLAVLETERNPAEGARRALQAARRFLDQGVPLGAATSLDLALRGAHHLDDSLRSACQQMIRTAVELTGRGAIHRSASGEARDVVLLGHAAEDRALIQERIEICRQRGENPLWVRLRSSEAALPGAECLNLGAQDAGKLAEELVGRLGTRGVLRAEILSQREPCFWAFIAAAAGLAITAAASFERDLPFDAAPGREDRPAVPVEPMALQAIRPADARIAVTQVDRPAPEISVIIPCNGRSDALSRLLHSLRHQTLERGRFEVIVVDDGAVPPLSQTVPADLLQGVKLLTQANQGPGAARNSALRVARADVVVFLNGDALLGDAALERHLQAQRRSTQPVAVLGTFHPTQKSSNLVVEMAHRSGLMFPTKGLPAGSPLSPQYFWTCNISVPRRLVDAVGRFDEACRPMCEDVELGIRLAQRGVHVIHDPSIECYHDHPMSLADFLTRCRWLGHDWVRVARKHGLQAPPLFDEAVEPTPELAERLLKEVLTMEDKVSRFVQTLEEAESQVNRILSEQPERREDVLSRLEVDCRTLLESAAYHEIRRGVVGGILGFTPVQYQAQTTDRTRMAAVFYLRDKGSIASVRRLLDSLPEDSELIVLEGKATRELRLPVEQRLRRILLARPEEAANVKDCILRETTCQQLAFVDGSHVPARSEWASLRLLHAAAPVLGAVVLGARSGEEVARAHLARGEPSQAVVLVRREVLQEDSAGGAGFLARMQLRGWFLAEVNPAGSGERRESLQVEATEPVEAAV